MSMQPQEVEQAGGFAGWLLHMLKGRPPQPEPEVRTGPRPSTPLGFHDIVGRDREISLLRAEIAAARKEGRAMCHVVLYGGPGLGKTLLAEATAREAGYSFYPVSGVELQTQLAVFQTLDRCVELQRNSGRPILLAIDEVDSIARAASYVLHSVMTAGVAWYAGQELYRGLRLAVFGTTNRFSAVPPAMRSRFREALFLDYYPEGDLAEIARREAVRSGVEAEPEALAWIAANSGGEPRKCLHVLAGCRNLADRITVGVAREALRLSGLYPGGLSTPQRQVLEFLRDAEGQTAGLSSLAAFTAMDAKDLTAAFEPFLIRRRLTTITGRGRKLTPGGLAALG